MLDAPYKSPVCFIVNEDPDVDILIDDALLVISPDVAIEVLANPPACEIDAVVVTPFFIINPLEPVLKRLLAVKLPVTLTFPLPATTNKLLFDELLSTNALFASLSFFIVTYLLIKLVIAVSV